MKTKIDRYDVAVLNGYINHAYKRWLGSKSQRDKNVLDGFLLVARTILDYSPIEIDQAMFGKSGTLDDTQARLFNLIISNK